MAVKATAAAKEVRLKAFADVGMTLETWRAGAAGSLRALRAVSVLVSICGLCSEGICRDYYQVSTHLDSIGIERAG